MTDIDEALHPVLPRELTSVSGDVRVVPGPPAPLVDEPYGLRIADPVADAEMVSHWMNLPHLVAAWEYPWPPQRWQRYMQAQLEGEYSRPFIGGFRGRDVAYIEIYRAAKDSIATRYDADPYDLGLHVAVADLTLLNRGLVPLLFPKVVASLFEVESRCRRVMFDPDHRNAGARRVCEFAGCTFHGEHDMANRRMALYALPRTPDDIPAAR
ncbi:GNAT family N-acetyltransferase [Mycolicibacterium sp. CR10]|uniref:GNAT family N-acetyltransferase n=1 Tax=Mycolicibacterium sp. CR10 TaxID=2562314 RepID=UPI0010C12C90|nr:GNAT family N-acetyltransferase [Mycolicibacterium sp. CR10]